MANIQVKLGETLFDFADRIYGHALGVHWLVEDNLLSGVTVNLAAHTSLIVRTGQQIELLPVKSAQEFIVLKTPDYEIGNYQSIFDVVMEKHGDIEGVFAMVEENGFDGLTEYLWEGRPLKVNAKPYSPRIQKALGEFMPIATIEEYEKSDGIGFMYVEINFIVK